MLKLNGIDYTYPDGTKALNKVTIDYSRGSCIGIIGENGAGKSTLFMNSLAILKPQSGSVYFEGEPLKYDKKSLRKLRTKVNMLLQNPDRQIFYSRVADDIAFALKNLELSENEIGCRVASAMMAVGIEHLGMKNVNMLSFGQKKRVALAGIIAMKPGLILLDEPTAGLDPLITGEMTGLIKDLIESGIRIAISSHDMDFIYRVCDYLYVIKDGTLISEGATFEVFSKGDMLKSAGLKMPLLVSLHLECGLPALRSEEELINYLKLKKKV